MADAFSDAFSFLKALNPSSIHEGDADLPEDQKRHYGNYQRALQMFGRPKPTPEPIFSDEWVSHNPWMGDANREHMGLPPMNPQSQPPQAPLPRTGAGPRTLPPNPPQMPPTTPMPNTQEMPKNIEQQARPLSDSNPYGRIRESELQRFADDYGIPFTKSWMFLKEEADMAALQAENNSLKARIDYLQGMIRILQQQRDEGLVGGD
jgi:hypothetical protein